MTKEDYIAELAGGLDCAGIPGDYDPSVLVDNIAEQVINAGYRKAEDVRRETLKEVLQELYSMIEYEKMGLDDEFLYGLNLAEDQIFILCEKYGVEVE
nr:MAG TPA: hypothetical protein [Caudoviricetes sp.]